MIPSLLLIRIRGTRSFWIPVPLFLFWPFIPLIWIVAKLVYFLIPSTRYRATSVIVGLGAFMALRGFRLAIGERDNGFNVAIY